MYTHFGCAPAGWNCTPSGCSSPCANTDTVAVVPSAEGRSTFTRPACVSVTKMSPLGATVIARGPARSFTNTSALNPAGSDSFAPAGLSMKRGKLLAEGDAYGAGSFARSMRCTRPGLSFFQSATPCGAGAAGRAPPGGGPKARGGAGLKVPSFSAVKYATTLSRSRLLRHRDHHRGAGHHGGRRGEEAVEMRSVPGDLRIPERSRVAESRSSCRGAADDTDQARALCAAIVIGLRAVAQRALRAEESLAGVGVGCECRCSNAEHRQCGDCVSNFHESPGTDAC